MRKFALLGLAVAATLALPASAFDGKIDFEGEVSSNTCVINGGSTAPLKVILPKVQVSQLSTAALQATAAHTRFTIGLTGCTGTGNARVFFEANGTNIDYTANALKNKDVSAQKATGIGFAIFDEDRTRIQLGLQGTQGSKTFPITTGAATLGYEVAYVKIASTVTAGKVLGTVEYSIKYD
jgi:major type 1 subunit fimbrin (pilin)